MRLGYNTNGFAHHRLEDALGILAEIGYKSVALTLDYHALDPSSPGFRKQLDTVRSLLKSNRLRSVIETGARYLLDPRRKHQPTLLSVNREDRARRAAFLRDAIDIAQSLGSDAVSFWSGSADAVVSPSELQDRLVHECKEVCKYAEKKNVRLAFEPEPGMLIATMSDFTQLHERVAHPLFGLTMDVGHLHCQSEHPIASHIHQWNALLWNIHIEDMRANKHEHLLFGEGEMEYGSIFEALKSIGYEGGLHVELSRHSHNAVETARRSLAFLRDQMG